EWRRIAGGLEPGRRHENRAQPRLGVVAHDVTARLAVDGALERGIADAVGEPCERRDRAAAKFGRGEDAIDGEEARVARRALGSGFAAQRRGEQGDKEKIKKT